MLILTFFLKSNNWRAISVESLQTIIQNIYSTNCSSSEVIDLSHMSSSTPFETSLDLLIHEFSEKRRQSQEKGDSMIINSSSNENIIGTLLVCGSGYIMSKVRKLIGVIESE